MGQPGTRWSMSGAAAIFTTFILILLSGQALASSGESGGGVTVIPDGSVFIQIANFLFLIFALNLILYRPIRKILSDRREKIKGLESSTENAAKSLQEKERTLAKAIKDARARGLKEKENLVTAGGRGGAQADRGDQRPGPVRTGADPPEDRRRGRNRAPDPATAG